MGSTMIGKLDICIVGKHLIPEETIGLSRATAVWRDCVVTRAFQQSGVNKK